MSDMVFGRPFVLRRDRDLSGVSGTGIVADGVEFPDGHAVIHWRGKWALTTPHPDGVASIVDIHDHGGQGDLHIIWADEFEAARRELMVDVVDAFDVPPQWCGPEAETAYLRREVARAVQAVQDGRAAPVEAGDERIVEAVMPVVGKVLEERGRWRNLAGRAYTLAYRWQGAHGASAFLVRAAGTELREALDESRAGHGDVVHSAAQPQVTDLPGVGESGLVCVCGARTEWTEHSFDPGWIHSPGSDTTCPSARPRCPECQMPHRLVPGRPPMCRALRAHVAPDTSADNQADKNGPTIPNHQVNGGDEPDKQEVTAATGPVVCDVYQPPTDPQDTGFYARCGMYDYKHRAQSAESLCTLPHEMEA
ncbi:hypothetical protein [Streptomyces antibioticus]|uniref:hypothetical protein n=1 Tax=Streptomyces antibioticus TaxID=1890 RepID=UPI0036BF2FE6